jgi:hypothetical protein
MTKYDNHRIELGANWIHGIMGNPIYELALKHKLIDQLSNTNTGKHIVEARTPNGDKVDIKVVEEIYKTYFYFIKKCENYFQIENSEGPIRCNNSVGQHLRADIDSWINGLKNEDNDSKQLKRSIFNTLLNRETCISGSHSMDEVSLKDFGSYTELPGGNITIPVGYNQLLSCLINEMNAKLASKSKLGDKSNFSDEKQLSILKSHRVIKIKWKDMDNNNQNNAKTNAEVICDNGSIFRCNHVVVTLPLGVLKRDAIALFEPKLPQYKLDSINTLGFGTVDKIFLEYSLPLNSLIDENLDEILLLWDSENSLDSKWFHKIYSISKITNHCLLLWVSGQEALHLEQLKDEEINQQLTQLLQKFLNNKKFPKADNLIVTRWGSDPFSCGSYAYVKNNGSVRDIELLSQPIYADPAHDKVLLKKYLGNYSLVNNLKIENLRFPEKSISLKYN